MYSIVNNLFWTAQKHVSHDCQVQGDFASDITVFMSDYIWCTVLNSSPGCNLIQKLSEGQVRCVLGDLGIVSLGKLDSGTLNHLKKHTKYPKSSAPYFTSNKALL